MSKTPNDPAHARPKGVSDETVAAVGKVSEAFEWVERARGHLYELHQLLGRADFLFGDAADLLEKAGHSKQADLIRDEVVGRNLLNGRWTFQIVDEFEETYYRSVQKAEKQIRDDLVDGRKHIYESELKEKRRTHGHENHESRP